MAKTKELGLAPLIAKSETRETPAFWFSKRQVAANYQRFRRGLPNVKIFFTLKSNAVPAVVHVLVQEGAHFDVASLGEIRLLRKLKVSPERMFFTTPVKIPAEIRAAYRIGVRHFVADSMMEISKLARYAPGSNVFIRFRTSNKGSQWPLSRRFGAETSQVLGLLQFTVEQRLVPYGLAFHVGSQCSNVQNWQQGIRRAAALVNTFKQKSGYDLKVIDIGGGFPVCYTKDVPSLETIFSAIQQSVKRYLPGLEIWAEPGRAMVADTGFAVTTVIGRTKRGRDNWLFCDLGAFNGLLELIEPSSRGFAYEIYAPVNKVNGSAKRVSNGNGKKKMFTLTGPSCDGDDIIIEHVNLADIGVGDRIYLLKTGAYSIMYASKFCGNKQPKVHVV
ncbi:MAG: type III PLP-dependent enzyme [Patescibacteria group bacterium]